MHLTTIPQNRISGRLLAVIALIAGLLWSITLSGCSTTFIGEQEPDEPVAQILPTKLAIIHTGGIEGTYTRTPTTMGISAVARIKSDLQEQGYQVLLLDSGNSLGGNLATDIDRGESAVGFMNAAGYDALALGRHELALGGKTLKKRMSQSSFAYLSANVLRADSQEVLSQANTTFKLDDGRLVGVFGLTTPGVKDQLGPLSTGEMTFSYHTLEDLAQQQVNDLHSQGCRLIVCLANLGFDEQGLPRANQVVSQVSGIDVLLDASTGETASINVADASGDNTLVVETASRLTSASIVCWEMGELSVRGTDPRQAQKLDEQVSALVTQSIDDLDKRLGRVVTTSREAMMTDRPQSDSTGLGQLAADAILWDASQGMGKSPDAAIITAASLTGQLPQGNVTQLDAMTALSPATTRLCLVETTGAQLQTVLAPLLAHSEPSSDMPQIAGIQLEETPAGEGQQPTRTIKQVGGRAFSPTDTYTIVTFEPLVAGAGSLDALYANGSAITDPESCGGKALADYLSHECKDGIPERYYPPRQEETPAEAPTEAPAEG
ncbi:MAG: bifunctional metallophosphatase/5'-nucleotidase [Atopobiaceae bacterium]|nr:bifunctional metallophosphatase/5'-nucleotidase [Atopobiaceae bacterium]